MLKKIFFFKYFHQKLYIFFFKQKYFNFILLWKNKNILFHKNKILYDIGIYYTISDYKNYYFFKRNLNLFFFFNYNFFNNFNVSTEIGLKKFKFNYTFFKFNLLGKNNKIKIFNFLNDNSLLKNPHIQKKKNFLIFLFYCFFQNYQIFIYRYNYKNKQILNIFLKYLNILKLNVFIPNFLNFKLFIVFFLSSCLFKNSQILWNYFYLIILKFNFFRQRNWLVRLIIWFRNYGERILESLSILGLKIIFKGKLNKFAGKKKQNFSINCGSVSITTRIFKNSMFSNSIWTVNGTINCTVILIY